MSKNDGGPAFPVAADGVHIPDCNRPDIPYAREFPGHPGMTLRDHFAWQALGSITANDFALNNYIPSQIAEWAYQMADAMIAERDR